MARDVLSRRNKSEHTHTHQGPLGFGFINCAQYVLTSISFKGATMKVLPSCSVVPDGSLGSTIYNFFYKLDK